MSKRNKVCFHLKVNYNYIFCDCDLYLRLYVSQFQVFFVIATFYLFNLSIVFFFLELQLFSNIRDPKTSTL